MEDTIEYLPRARRRAYLGHIRRRARHLARQRYARQFTDSVYAFARVYSEHDFYKGLIRGEGHWMYGGCARARCGLCQPRELQVRYQRELARLDAEYRAWEQGEFDTAEDDRT